MLNQFQLIDPEINDLQNEITNLQYMTGPQLISLRELVRSETPWNDEYTAALKGLIVAVERSEQLRQIALEKYTPSTIEAIDKFELTIPDRIAAAERILEKKARLEQLPIVSSEAPCCRPSTTHCSTPLNSVRYQAR